MLNQCHLGLVALLCIFSFVLITEVPHNATAEMGILTNYTLPVFRPYTSYLQQLKFKKYYRYVIIAISMSLNVSLMLVAAIRWGLLNNNYGSALNYFPITAVAS